MEYLHNDMLQEDSAYNQYYSILLEFKQPVWQQVKLPDVLLH